MLAPLLRRQGTGVGTGLAAICLAIFAIAPGCAEPDSSQNAAPSGSARGPLQVLVVNYPLQYFVQRIGAEEVQVEFPAPTDVDPAYWTPDARTIEQYQAADLILVNGGYAKWTATVSLPESKVVNTTAQATDRYIEIADATTHTHGPEGEHAHEGTAFTTWLDLELAMKQAQAVAEALNANLPEKADVFNKNLQSLQGDLQVLHKQLSELTAHNPELPVLFSHPVYQYLARAYHINGQSVHWEPDQSPTDEQWTELKQLLEKHPATWMIWERTPLAATKKQLQELGVSSVVYNPCANAPADADFLSEMRKDVLNLKKVYAGK